MSTALGVKVAEMVQVALVASDEVQPLVIVKALELVPLRVALLTVRLPPPVLVRVVLMEAAVLPTFVVGKVMEVFEKVAIGVLDVPAPLRATICCPLEALSLKVKVPL